VRRLPCLVIGLFLAAHVSFAAEPPAEGMLFGQVTDAETSRRLAKIVVTATEGPAAGPSERTRLRYARSRLAMSMTKR
jgi:hypothetical protein